MLNANEWTRLLQWRRAQSNTPEAEEKRKIISFLRLMFGFVIHIFSSGGAAEGHELEKDGLGISRTRVREP